MKRDPCFKTIYYIERMMYYLCESKRGMIPYVITKAVLEPFIEYLDKKYTGKRAITHNHSGIIKSFSTDVFGINVHISNSSYLYRIDHVEIKDD